MAPPPQSPEASEIRRRGRQRLIGAVAIALLLIVFVPMLLDSEPRAKRDEPKLDIPPRDNAPALPPPVAAPAQAAPKVAVVVPKAEPKAAQPKAAEPKVAEPKPAAAAKTEGFAIQVGAFADDDKLKQVRDKLIAAKVTTYTEPAGSLTRLRVGPFATREDAEKTAATVRKSVPEAKVIPLP